MAITTIPSSGTTDGTNLVKISSTSISSGSSSVEFTSGIDSTYKIHVFKFVNVHATSNDANFTFRASTDGGSTYGIATTSNFANGYSQESGTANVWTSESAHDSHANTGDVQIGRALGADNDQSNNIEMWLYDWSGTTHTKKFNAFGIGDHQIDYSLSTFTAGYVNTTSAIDAIKFSPSAGNFDSGDIILYGVRT